MADVIREETNTTESDRKTIVLHGGIVAPSAELHVRDGGSADDLPDLILDGGSA